MIQSLKRAACGFVMGLADLVPGISGGTVAFILGIWQELIASIGNLGKGIISFKKELILSSLAFLLPLISGIVFALFLFTKTVDAVLNSPAERISLYSAFVGLIIASSLICLKKMQKPALKHLLPFLAAVLAALFLTSAKPYSNQETAYHVPLEYLSTPFKGEAISNIDLTRGLVTDVEESTLLAMLSKGVLKPHQEVIDSKGSKVRLADIQKKNSLAIDPWIVFCGAAAISAMLLPGISGSYLLVILGMYPEVIANTADFISSLKQGSFDGDSFFFLSQFALGILIGAALFSKLIGTLFERYQDHALALLSGFVLGSLRAVWPFWTFSLAVDPLRMEKGPRLIAEMPFFPEFDLTLASSIAIAASGFALVLLIEFLADKKRSVYS